MAREDLAYSWKYRLWRVWLASIFGRSSVLFVSLLAVALAGGDSSFDGAVILLSALLLTAGIAQFISDDREMMRQETTLSIHNQIGKLILISVPISTWGTVVGLSHSILLVALAAVIQIPVARWRTFRVSAGELTVPHVSNLPRDLATIPFWLVAAISVKNPEARENLVAAGVAAGASAQFLFVRFWPPETGANHNWVHHDARDQRATSSFLILGLGVHSVVPIAMRLYYSRVEESGALASYEVVERFGYLATSLVIGGVGSEIQRAQMTGQLPASRRSIYLFSTGVICLGLVTALCARAASGSFGFGLPWVEVVLIGISAGVSAALTVAVRVLMGFAALKIDFGLSLFISGVLACGLILLASQSPGLRLLAPLAPVLASGTLLICVLYRVLGHLVDEH